MLVYKISGTNGGCCRSGPGREKVLGICVVIAVGVCILLTSILVWYVSASKEETSKTVVETLTAPNNMCLVPECIHTASRVLKYMDMKADPCESFYSYACGEFQNTTYIPEGETEVNMVSLTRDLIFEQLHRVVQEPISESDTRPARIAKKLYQACFDTALIEEHGFRPMKKILKELGGWPVLEGNRWDETGFNWISTMHKLRRLGLSFSTILRFNIDPNVQNSSQRVISVDQPAQTLGRKYLLEGIGHKRVRAYLEYRITVAILLGADRDSAELELKETLQFETFLANISRSKEEKGNLTHLYNLMTIEKMQERFPSIPWLEYINNILQSNVRVDKNKVINVLNPKFITKLEELLTNIDKRTLANYIVWKAASSMVFASTHAMLSASLKYANFASGVQQEQPRWRKCTENVANALPLAIGSIYARRFFKKEAKQEALNMVNEIQDAFADMIANADWMDQTTRELAMDKAETITFDTGYPPEFLGDVKMNEIYDKLEVNETMYLESMLNVSKYDMESTVLRLHERFNKTNWKMHRSTTNLQASYLPVHNGIQLSAEVLQGVFFDRERPKYMNYGAIGSVVGQEAMQGFDIKGLQHNSSVNMRSFSVTKANASFPKKQNCAIASILKSRSKGVQLKPLQTLEDTLINAEGVKGSYSAYLKWSLRQREEEKRLPGLQSRTPRQMFWVAAAQIWCSSYRSEAKGAHNVNHKDSLKKLQVDAAFSQIEEFATEFNCPKGSKMNPERKCKVW